MKPKIIIFIALSTWLITSCKPAEDTQMESLAEKMSKIEAIAEKYAQLNAADIFNWDELSSLLEQQGAVERFDLVKYEACLQNWVEFSKISKELWLDCGCEDLHNEGVAILKAPEQSPGSNWQKFQKHKSDHKAAFDKCAANKAILDKKRSELHQPCVDLQAIIAKAS